MDAITASLLTTGSLYTFGFVLALAVYNLLVKKYLPGNVTLIALFWVNTFTYVAYVSWYLFKRFYFRGDVYAIEELLHDYTIYNAPLYILLALGFVGSFIMFDNLIQKYEISVIIGFSQISLLFTSLAVILLGGPYSWQSLLGTAIVFLGAVIVPLKGFSSISPSLIYNIVIYALLLSNERVITFLLTQETETTQLMLGTLEHVFPFDFQKLFLFIIGSRFYITIIFLIYLMSRKQYKGKIISTLKTYFAPIAVISLVYYLSVLTLQFAFVLTENKLVLGSLAKLTVPVLIILGYIILKEKITWPKIIGSAIIVIGGSIALFL